MPFARPVDQRRLRRAGVQVEEAAPRSATLIGRLTFDQVSGDFLPSVGTVRGVPTGAVERRLATLTSSGDGKSIALDGSTSYVTLEHHASLEVPLPGFNIYFQLDVVPDTKFVLLAKDAPGAPGGTSIELRNVGGVLRLTGYKRNAAGSPMAFNDDLAGGVATIAAKVGYKLTMGTEEGSTRLWLDDVEVGTIADDAGWEDNTQNLVLGAYTTAAQDKLDGVIGRFDIYDGPLTSDQREGLPDAITISHDDDTTVAQFQCLARSRGDLVVPAAQAGGSTHRVTEAANTRFNAYNGGAHRVWQFDLVGPQPSGNVSAIMLSGADGGCWNGGAVIGTQSLTKQRAYANFGNSRAFLLGVDGTLDDFLIEGVRVHNFWDAFARAHHNTVKNLTIRGCWVTHNRDDFIELDNHYPDALIDDCLIDGTYMGFSGRGGSGSADFATIRDCLVRLEPTPQGNAGGGPNPGHGMMFKLDGNSERYDISDTIFAWQQGTSLPISDDVTGVSNDPLYDLSPARYNKLRSSSNVTICWLGSGSYPSGWWVPSGWTVLTGSRAQNTWKDAAAAWKTKHALVYRIPGVDT